MTNFIIDGEHIESDLNLLKLALLFKKACQDTNCNECPFFKGSLMFHDCDANFPFRISIEKEDEE